MRDYNILRKTTLHFENGNKQSTTIFENGAEEYKRPLMKAIVAFEIEVSELGHVFKLSQDRDEKSYHVYQRETYTAGWKCEKGRR